MFLSEKLWTSGIITVLAAFLLWQSWTRELQLRKETHERENRMAGRIDRLETQHAEDLAQVIAAVTLLEDIGSKVDSMRTQVNENCSSCEARRHDIISSIQKLRG